MSFSVGIVGLPNVGKSTLFSALTEAQVDCANYPFCTIEPNKAIVAVPDERLSQLAELEKSEQTLPTTIEFVDIAGLVAGAHKGEGLGNKFLSNIREVDAIVHLIRDFEDPNVVRAGHNPQVRPVESFSGLTWNPKEDKQIILLELILADLEYIQKIIQGVEKRAKADKEEKARLTVLKRVEESLLAEKLVSAVELSKEEKELLKNFQFLTAKPIITVRNVSGQGTYTGLTRVKSPEPKEAGLAIDVKLEYEISQLPEADREALSNSIELDSALSNLTDLISAAYKALNLITFITAGPKETRAWTVTEGSKAPAAAGRIHTDFEKGFIKAEVIAWDKLLEAGGYGRAREKGWLRLEGKEYVVQDGDVVHFKFNV